MTTSTQDRPMRADARRNYDRIVEVARATFAELGADAPLDEIAKRASVGPGTLYRHFPTREDLLAGALHRDMGRLIDRAAELEAAPSAAAALVAWLRDFVAHVNVYRGLPSSACSAIRDPESPLHLPCESMTKAGGTLLERAQAEGSVRADLDPQELFFIANAIAWAADQAGGGGERTERLLELLREGITPRPDR
ncbi:MAG: TetR/AcrR family transcriptional regulator [Jiangellaceae bacterium]